METDIVREDLDVGWEGELPSRRCYTDFDFWISLSVLRSLSLNQSVSYNISKDPQYPALPTPLRIHSNPTSQPPIRPSTHLHSPILSATTLQSYNSTSLHNSIRNPSIHLVICSPPTSTPHNHHLRHPQASWHRCKDHNELGEWRLTTTRAHPILSATRTESLKLIGSYTTGRMARVWI